MKVFGLSASGGLSAIRTTFLALGLLFGTVVAVAEPSRPPATSGFYRGAAYQMVHGAYGESIAQSSEIAECSIFPDGKFRLAVAPGADGLPLWTRGSWTLRGSEGDGGEWLEFSCNDLGGVLIGHRNAESLELVYRPKPFQERRFRLERRGPSPAPGSGWPLRAEFPGGAPGQAGVYLGRMAERDGEGILLVSPDGMIHGAMRVPLANGDRQVLAPLLGQWRTPSADAVSAGAVEASPDLDHVLTWHWGKPSPAAGWERPSLRGSLDPDGGRLSARASLAGMPLDQTTWRRLPIDGSSVSADAADVGTDGNGGEPVYALLQSLSQNGAPTAGDPTRLFPLRLDFSNNRLLMRSPDDPDGWLSFPLEQAPDGRLLVNRDGKEGSLVRLGSGIVAAFVVRTPPAVDGMAFPSVCMDDLLVLTLDLTVAPLGSAKAAAAGATVRRDRVILVARRTGT